MRDRRIVVEPFSFINLLGCTVKKHVGEHATALVQGIISEEAEDKYIEMALKETQAVIKAVDDEGAETVIFSGFVCDARLHNENLVRTLTIELVTQSYRMDRILQTRTFQNAGMTYDEVLDFIGADYTDYDVMMTTGSGTAIGDLIVQYQETDWAFARRMASHFNTFLVPDYIGGKQRYFFGMPQRGDGKAMDPISYTIHKAVGEFIDKTENDVDGLSESDAMYYWVKDREIYELGQRVTFKGRELYIFAVQTELEGEELVHYYSLKSEAGFKPRRIFNERMIGASLDATIIEVQQDTVKAHVHCDEKQDKATAKWFSYSTVYSSPDGTGWYCMPEEGDSVRLYFPDETEPEGYVISAAHLTSDDKKARTVPDNKSLRTKWGKELLLTPDSIVMTNNNGMSISLLDEEGISIVSDKAIRIVSEESIAVASVSADLQVTASEKITMKQGASQMDLQDGVVLSGAQLNVQE